MIGCTVESVNSFVVSHHHTGVPRHRVTRRPTDRRLFLFFSHHTTQAIVIFSLTLPSLPGNDVSSARFCHKIVEIRLFDSNGIEVRLR